jgi:hypothetical protein
MIMSTPPASNEAIEPVAIAERQPEFPCWLWCSLSETWWHRDVFPDTAPEGTYTHWLPDSPARPTVKPEQK